MAEFPQVNREVVKLTFSALKDGMMVNTHHLKGLGDFEEDLNKIIDFVALVGVQAVRDKIEEKGLVKTGALRAGIFAEVKEYSVVFHSRKTYGVYLERGIKPHPMNYLIGKTIPFIIRGGKFVFAGRGSGVTEDPMFRKVTQKTIAAGSWFHPGIKPQNFFMEALEEIIEKASERFPLIKLNLQVL